VIQHIIVGTDQSDEAAIAATWAGELALATQGEVTTIQAWSSSEAERTPERGQELRAAAGRRLQSWADRFDTGRASATLAIEGPPEQVLSDAARRLPCELVVIGSRPFEGLTSLGLGSLAHHLVQHLPCPLVVVPAQDRKLSGGWLVVDDDGSQASQTALRWSEALAWQIGAGVCPVRHIDHDPVQLLQHVADARGGGLIVVSARQQHSLGGHLLGLTPSMLLHHPVHPVAVLPHGYTFAAA
jgi:nucleotide-binding universal stress UspA family protein